MAPEESTPTFYQTLEVAEHCSDAVIQAAYKAMIKRYHPDLNGDDRDGAERRAKEINEAFRVLGDPQQRSHYDAELRSRRAVGGGRAVISMNPGQDARVGVASPLLSEGLFGGSSHARSGSWLSGHWRGLPRSMALVLLIAGIVAALSYTALRPRQASRLQTASSSSTRAALRWGAAQPEEPRSIMTSDIVRGVREFKRVSAGTSRETPLEYSIACHRKIKQTASWKIANVCFGFDAAASAGRELEASGASSAGGYFSAKSTDQRLHNSLAGVFGLKASAVTALAAEIYRDALGAREELEQTIVNGSSEPSESLARSDEEALTSDIPD